jgi:HK97 family phage portal protein
MSMEELGIDPEDMQLLESRSFSKEEVCTWFGVPPSMIGSGDKASSWASSSESLNLWFLQYTLTPWLRRIEQAIWKDLLTPEERARYFAEFQVEGLLRANTAGRTALYSSALQNGWMSRNEVRRLENLPKIEGGDEFTVQSNLMPIDQLTQTEERTPAVALEDALKNFLQLTTRGAEHGTPTH